ncbi:(2Fe-2S)-binding protein [Carboxylicivirga sediminis]|uniref:Bacterioferritin-associated ferredoxin n=1 Tax=Carboxylicivirga sediminis TaxID=2006564 RepID=A0A941F2X9_9BACT|nr:(2Fe-2S)-binding protein [Carboxylicivirga sediminis]MBR8535329.1 (2Fe-2S)-binding protein [Carboxylicivirga sediminis]
MSKLICLCNGVREKELIDTINNVDMATLEIIQNKTGAGTNCGRCINSIEAFLEKQESKHN